MLETIKVGYQRLDSIAGNTYHHKFITYTNSNGIKYYAEAGPDNKFGNSVLDLSATTASPNSNSSAYGALHGYWQIGEKGNEPYAPIVGNELLKVGEDLSLRWEDIKEAISHLNSEKHTYRPTTTNSNAFIDEVLDRAGLPKPQLDGQENGGYWTPGSDQPLPPGQPPASPPGGSTPPGNPNQPPPGPNPQNPGQSPNAPGPNGPVGPNGPNGPGGGHMKNGHPPGNPPLSPILLDLDGNGITTTNVYANNHYFDHDTNGYAEKTGWVAQNDGILVLDRNNDGFIKNGRELFGNNTLLANNQLASQGFEALSELDINADGKIDSLDTLFTQLRVVTGQGLVKTLTELGIQSLSLTTINTNITDAAGNIKILQGLYTKTDGTTAELSDYLFQTDALYSQKIDAPSVPTSLYFMPDAQGFGNVMNLRQAMALDTSGVLKTLVEQYAATTDPTARLQVLDNILFKWAGVDGVNPSSAGESIDARLLKTVEAFYAIDYLSRPNVVNGQPGMNQTIELKDMYRHIKDVADATLMRQSHLAPLVAASMTREWSTSLATVNLSAAQSYIQNTLTSNYEAGRQQLTDYARMLYILGYSVDQTAWSNFYNHFASQGLELKAALDWAWTRHIYGTNASETLHDLELSTISSFYPHAYILAGDGNDTVDGNNGNDFVDGGSGNDTIYGDEGKDTLFGQIGNDNLYGDNGDDVLIGHGGTDWLWGDAGSDQLTAGSGNDYVRGGDGNDTYFFKKGDGQDSLREGNSLTSDTGIDVIKFGDILPNEVNVTGRDNALILSIAGTGDTITIEDFLKNGAWGRVVDKLEFADGSFWDLNMQRPTWLSGFTINGTSSGDVLYGNDGSDTISGLAGGDIIRGRLGQDIIMGGSGVDSLYGEDDNDTYNYNRGDGSDSITEYSGTTEGSNDRLVFTDQTISTNQLVLRLVNFDHQADTWAGDLEIRFRSGSTSDRITLNAQSQAYNTSTSNMGIEGLYLSNGNGLTEIELNQLVSDMIVYSNANGNLDLDQLSVVQNNTGLLNLVANYSGWNNP